MSNDTPRSSHRADALPPGTLLEGCEIVRVVADSSFAIVYLAREPGSERRYAIKEYLPVSLALRSADGRRVALRAPEHAEAFERGLLAFAAEAQLLEQRTHPALLRVLRCWQAHGSIYRQMPWLEGDSLLQLRRGLAEPPDEATLRRLLFGLLGALQTLHDAGEVHGAVSPGNIMLLSDDRPVLLDTDAVARTLVGDQTRALMALVSPGFAPRVAEVGAELGSAQADSQGPAADLHALAAVAHFCITGVLPGAGVPHEALAAASRARNSRPAYSAGLLEAIDNALSDDPSRRPRSVAAFRASLAGQPEAAAAPAGKARTATAPAPVAASRPARARARRRSQRFVTWSVAGFMALLVGGSLVVWRERSSLVVPADVATPTVEELAPPAAQTLPAERSQHAASTVAAPAEPRISPAPKPAKSRGPTAVATSGSPREECGARTEFALYRCMRTECQLPRWQQHAQCQRLRKTDMVE